MKRAAALTLPGKTRWTFVVRQSTSRGSLTMKKVAVGDLEDTRGRRPRTGARVRLDFNGSSVPEPALMAERRGTEVWFALDAPAPRALESLLPRWRPRHR